MLDFAFIFIFIVSACAPRTTPTIYRPPAEVASATPIIFTAIAPTTPFPIPDTPIPEPPTPTPPCTNELTWMADLTFPDDTVVLPGQTMEKQWQVQNSGTCDWDARYRLRNVNEQTLGAAVEIPLYPARSGATITLIIFFIAPAEAGTYRSEWKAIDPDGSPFGDGVYIKVVVGE